MSHEVVCFQMLDFETSKSNTEVSKSNAWKITSFAKTTSEGAVTHNGLHYQQLPNARYQVRFYANNYFEKLPRVSTAFKVSVYFAYISSLWDQKNIFCASFKQRMTSVTRNYMVCINLEALLNYSSKLKHKTC